MCLNKKLEREITFTMWYRETVPVYIVWIKLLKKKKYLLIIVLNNYFVLTKNNMHTSLFWRRVKKFFLKKYFCARSFWLCGLRAPTFFIADSEATISWLHINFYLVVWSYKLHFNIHVLNGRWTNVTHDITNKMT